MNIMSLDLELNQLDRKNPKIIQVGAAVYKVKDGELLGTFMVYVDPKESIIQEITNLTGIKDSDVEGAISVTDAYFRLKEFAKSHKAFKNSLVWGSGVRNDSSSLHQEAKVEEDNFMGFRVLDAKTLYQSLQIMNNDTVRGGLKKACDTYQIGWDDRFGPEHRALADAHNTFRIWHFMTKKFQKGFKN